MHGHDVRSAIAFRIRVLRGARKSMAGGVVLLLLLLTYPITLTKLALFAPFWLLYVALYPGISKLRSDGRFVTVSGLVRSRLVLLVKSGVLRSAQIIDYFGAINFRMIAFPSIALDIYNDFFSTHAHTYFCQISLVRRLVDCPYTDPLAIVMAKTYHFGNRKCLAVCDGRHRLGWTVAGAAGCVRVRTGDSARKPPVCRFAAALCRDIRSFTPQRAVERTAVNFLADIRCGASFSALVYNAPHNVRTNDKRARPRREAVVSDPRQKRI